MKDEKRCGARSGTGLTCELAPHGDADHWSSRGEEGWDGDRPNDLAEPSGRVLSWETLAHDIDKAIAGFSMLAPDPERGHGSHPSHMLDDLLPRGLTKGDLESIAAAAARVDVDAGRAVVDLATIRARLDARR